MSCNNYTTTKIPVSIGFDANGNAGSLIESKEVVVTKISAYTDPASDQTYDIEIDPGILNKVIIKSDVTVQGALTAQSTTILGASALSSLTDVTITSVADGEVLVWSSNDWINRTLSEAGILGTTDLANYATNTYVSSNYATSNSLSAYAPSSWVNSNFLGTGTLDSTTQRYGAALQALRTLATTNNTLPYFTGGAAATTTLTPFAKDSILAATNAATVVANIGAQPYNLNLQNIVDIGQPGIGFDTWVVAWSEGNGQFELQPQTGGLGSLSLNSLTDVAIATATNNDFLVYDGSDWVDQAPSVARTSLGATTLGGNLFTATNNSTGGDTYLKISSANGISLRTAAQMRTDLTAQEQNSTLTNIAGQAAVANTFIYFDNSNVAATTNLTSFGRSLIDDSDNSAARTTLGLIIDEDVQAFDQSLKDIKTYCDGTGASSFGRLLYTYPSGVVPGKDIGIVPLSDNSNIPNNYGKVLKLADPGSPYSPNAYAAPTWGSVAQSEITGLKTSDSPQFAGVNIGNAADTTITRVDAGIIAVENKRVFALKSGETPAEGDVFYFDGTDFVRLPKPSSTQAVLAFVSDISTIPSWIAPPNTTSTYFLKSTAGEISWGSI